MTQGSAAGTAPNTPIQSGPASDGTTLGPYGKGSDNIIVTALQAGGMQSQASQATEGTSSAQSGVLPSAITGLELTRDQYLAAVEGGLWRQVQGNPNSGFQNNADVAAATLNVQATPSVAPDNLSASADLSAFVRRIAEPTATATVGGADQEFEKVIVFGRNVGGEVVVRAIALVGSNGGRVPSVQGRIGLAHVHYAGLHQPPHAGDDSATRRGLSSFVIGSTGSRVWEVGRKNTINSIRSVLPNNQFGPWEAFQVNPQDYTIYQEVTL